MAGTLMLLRLRGAEHEVWVRGAAVAKSARIRRCLGAAMAQCKSCLRLLLGVHIRGGGCRHHGLCLVSIHVLRV